MAKFAEIMTPLDPDLLFHRLHAREALSQPGEFQIDLLSRKKDIVYDDILGKNVTVKLALPDPPLSSSKGSISDLNRMAKRSGYVGNGLFFAASTYASMLWCVDQAGIVRGSGEDGIVYGLGVSLDRWLEDMIQDLEYVCDNQSSLPWATEYTRPAR